MRRLNAVGISALQGGEGVKPSWLPERGNSRQYSPDASQSPHPIMVSGTTLNLNSDSATLMAVHLKPGIIPFMPRISLPMPPLENCFIIFCICSNWLSRRLTSCT